MSQDKGLKLGLRCLRFESGLLTTAKKPHPLPPCNDSLLHPSCKNREVSFHPGRAFARPCFHSPSQHRLLVPLFSFWLKLSKNGDVWGNITGLRNPGTSNLCRVYDSMFGSRSTLPPCRKALQIPDLLGYRCISEQCSALFVEFGDSFQ